MIDFGKMSEAEVAELAKRAFDELTEEKQYEFLASVDRGMIEEQHEANVAALKDLQR
jgi:hypothetical protein